MSRTLFWYILKDLIRVFLMASGVIAGIMSFGGLLRPLTEHGLSIGQVRQMLFYFQPAMGAYSLPIAALFATTMVYGRLSADNEIVGCRAAGISHLALAVPAFVLGLTVALLGLLLLCFIVPACMFKAEQVVFSNVGQIVANQIERSHQIKLDQGGESITVFAQGAHVMPQDPSHPNDQVVLLIGPMFVTYESTTDKSPDAIRIPRDFYIARQATAFISQNPDTDELSFTTVLQGGTKFPRAPQGMEGGVQSTIFSAKGGSMVRENTKFMDVWRLKELLKDESSSKRVNRVLTGFIAAEQTDTFLRSIGDQLTTEDSRARLVNGAEEIDIVRGKAAAILQDRKLIIGATSPQITRPVRVFQERNGQVLYTFEAQRVEISAYPDDEAGVLHAAIEFEDVIEQIGDSNTLHPKFRREFDVPMTDSVKELPKIRTAKYYLQNARKFPGPEKALARERMFISNTVRSELHARASFALSCLILVMVGCALGMMFRSGNFLSAFALSVVPALLCIALIITGQHTCENVPRDVTGFKNPFELGRNLIWSGNVAVAIIATVLLGRLQRQ